MSTPSSELCPGFLSMGLDVSARVFLLAGKMMIVVATAFRSKLQLIWVSFQGGAAVLGTPHGVCLHRGAEGV